jgi:hypothetical protein
MPQWLARQGRFWHYNYQVLAGTGYWVLVAPVAASQIVTLWMMALASEFGQSTALRIAELMTPILGAFLVAHSLAPEYRSGVGAVLACKPLSLSRVLVMRAGLGMLGALALTSVTLQACSLLLKRIDVIGPLLASVPSLWFFSALVLVFATIFRNPLGGFAVALALWSLDFALGYGVHPFLSVQGRSAALSGEALGAFWAAGKMVQLVVGGVLWWVHGRLLPRVCRPPERADVLKIAASCLLVIGAYCASGAATVVGYGYLQRSDLPQQDVMWLRRQLQVYGPVPVARLFGPAFAVYVSEPPLTRESGAGRKVRLEQLRRALARWPGSLWAEGIAFALAAEQESEDPHAAVAQYLSVADRFPRSPFAPKALGAILRSEDKTVTDDERLLAARRLLADYPRSREAERGAEVLGEHYPGKTRAEELLNAATVASQIAPVYRRSEWVLRRASLEAELGRPSEAGRHAREALAEARRLGALGRGEGPQATELRPRLGGLDSTAARAEALLTRLTSH